MEEHSIRKEEWTEHFGATVHQNVEVLEKYDSMFSSTEAMLKYINYSAELNIRTYTVKYCQKFLKISTGWELLHKNFKYELERK